MQDICSSLAVTPAGHIPVPIKVCFRRRSACLHLSVSFGNTARILTFLCTEHLPSKHLINGHIIYTVNNILKNIGTIVLVAGVATAARGQDNHQKAGDKNTGQLTNTVTQKFTTHRTAVYTFSAKEKDRQLAQVKQVFDLKVKSIVSNRRISTPAKGSLIKQAEAEKAQRTKAVNAKFDSKNNAAAHQ